MSRIDPLTNTSDIWQVDLQRDIATRVTLDRMNDMGPVWSPEGDRLVFRSDRAGGNYLFSTTAESGTSEALILNREVSNPTEWSRDGRHLLFHNTVATTGLDISSVNIAGDLSITAILQTRFDEFDARLSPDGRWFSYTSLESGRPDVYVQPYPPTGSKWTVSANGGAEARWRADGRELFYLSADRSVMSVPINTAATFRAGVPVRLFGARTPTFANPYRTNLDVASDGQRFIINVGPDAGSSSPVTIVVNWTAALSSR